MPLPIEFFKILEDNQTSFVTVTGGVHTSEISQNEAVSDARQVFTWAKNLARVKSARRSLARFMRRGSARFNRARRKGWTGGKGCGGVVS